MKTVARIISLVLVLTMVFAFSSCESSDTIGIDGDEYVLRYGDFSLDEKEYMYLASYVKNEVVYNQQAYLYQYTGTVYDEADILAMPIDEETTIADFISERTVQFAQQMLIIESLCAEAKLEVTDQEDIDLIDGYIADIEYAYGGEDLFEIALARLGFSRSGIERLRKTSVLYEMLYEHRYGENGIAKVPEETVNNYFKENYFSYDAAVFSYIDPSSGESIVFEYTDDEIKNYFDENYVKVRHILYKTVDSSGKELDESVVEEKKQSAESAYDAIINGEKTFEDFMDDTEDSGYEYTFTHGQMVDAFENASFEMEIGEVELVKSEFGYHIIEKLEKNDTDLYGEETEDGELEGGLESEVLKKMSANVIRTEALDVLEKLNNGELEEYPDTDDDKEYYSIMESSFIDKNNSTYQSLIDILNELEVGVYTDKEFDGEASYIFRTKEFSEEDITAEIYTTIEESLAMDAYSEYTESFYDSVEVNDALLEKFDVNTIPMLEEEFYTE